ncbi:YceI family protein [Bdellovibrio bacteriovorus]|uniref:YCE I like family protein n=1 Tax=Bdellovibrio bacteriovorus str. Tiberius TaxID=1069642 RepID=K7YVG8_BDEBC|nr:YceI family protein [Bdellovibrio bacteriovorus]AFY01658.1 YCE I like family protein [Bdellovibrio bacteriovorus str. Tiberius]
MFKTVLAAFVLVVAAHAQAADVYKIDTKASSVAWKGTKKVGESHNGGISVKEGEVTVDKGQLTGGNVVVDMTTITNADVKDAGYNKKLVGHLSTEDFFNAGKFPTSTFKITSVAPSKTKGEVLVKGEFTMIGGTHPIEFPAKVTVDKGVATGEAVVKIDRTKWGLKYGSGNFFKELAGDKIINDEFELTLKLVAKK